MAGSHFHRHSRLGGKNRESLMTRSNPSLLQRLSLAFGTFFGILSDAQFAARVRDLRAGETAPPPPPREEAHAPAAPLKTSAPDSALQLLGLLQREARFVDFIQEDVAAYSDADIGAAARLVHDGCRKVLREHFTLEPVRQEAEGSRVVLDEGFDAASLRLTGNVVGKAPFRGSLTHRGWRITDTRLPRLAEAHDPAIIAPAEVEL